MTDEKTALLAQMKKQRSLPLSDETHFLYESYAACIDSHNPDELSCLLFFEGEYFFRIGDFNTALHHLFRCIQAPKSASLKYLDALSCNIIGHIYGYLGQETIALNHLLQAKSISDELHRPLEAATCCASLGCIYQQLDLYETALNYYEEALSLSAASKEPAGRLTIFCNICRGIACCKLGRYEEARSLLEQVKSSCDETCRTFSDALLPALSIRLSVWQKNMEESQQLLLQMIHSSTGSVDFLVLSDFYFNLCSFFLEQHMPEAARVLLQHIKTCIADSPLVFLHYNYLKYKTLYARDFSSETDYLNLSGEFIALHSDYLKEQTQSKRYSLESVERLRQMKNDSEMYLEKSRIDQMTGLLNKYTIQFLVEEDLSKLSSSRQSALILIDLDHFKQINDTLGHLTGDSFICQTGSIIQNYFQDKALCGRVGGDEFLVYINDVTDISFVMLQAEILRQEIYRQTSERNITITTQASIGIAFSSEYCYDYESLFSAADGALYRAKLEGRNKVVVAE